MDKDLRKVLGDPVQGAFPQTYCGGGTLAGCRTALVDSLNAAVAKPANQVYPGDADCAAGDQWCADTIVHRAMGGMDIKMLSVLPSVSNPKRVPLSQRRLNST